MRVDVFRDYNGERQLVGYFRTDGGKTQFWYDVDYVVAGQRAGEAGLSESLELDFGAFEPREFSPFFQGLLPEGEVLFNLSQKYQVARSDFVAFLSRLGCESIGALTFLAETADIESYRPFYRPIEAGEVSALKKDPVREITFMSDAMRLSLAGAQSKLALYLPPEKSASSSRLEEWLVPMGAAPSSHIVKIARAGGEEIALNEYVCMTAARRAGFVVPEVSLVPGLPGAVAVRRYDRVPAEGAVSKLVRLHQEDFCQAAGLPTYLKYADAVPDVSYVVLMGRLVERVSENPYEDKIDLAARLLFDYAIGNSDNHLKNYAFLYSPDWRSRRLAPFYDVTCIPLTGYSTQMAFPLGEHRELAEIAPADLLQMTRGIGAPLSAVKVRAQAVVKAIAEMGSIDFGNERANAVALRILENSEPRLEVLRRYIDS